ncbi:hypothetical protein HG536_0B00530 [Torulaspora globosa]|uniref:HTH La-type RNA-binding domain-containing protein n=1 Tax=Torulaspora globosa TaxID=48254 RepID=A0A7G3ZCF6_9SACH|nr:uncharacterized protein HG536_0B00530 [Torulaspora globosa]QLL31192.1 hypothetical protein HG536_0B00530 [Torulaspora globosa]
MAVESDSAAASEARAPVVEVEAQAEVKKEPVLAPAPLPTKSPWKAVSADIPVSSISMESLESGKKKKKNKAGTPTISSSTKWVPMKASIVVSSPKKAGNGARKGNNKTTSAAGSKKKKQQSQQPARRHSPRSSGGDEEAKDESSRHKEGEEQSIADSKADVQSEYSTVGELQPTAGQGGRPAYQRRKHNHSNQFQHSAHQQNGFQRRRYHSNYNNNDLSRQQRYMHSKAMSPYQGRVPRPLGHDPHLINGHMQKAPYMVPMYQQFYSMQPILMAVNSIARQIEYYFSPENLANDKYLRSKLSKEGYAPLSLVARFYRIVNMSFGGDPSLILAALREIVFNQNSTVDVCYGTIENADDAGSKQEDHAILANYFVRSKQWEALLPEEYSTVIKIEKILENDALDEFMISAASMQEKAPIAEPQESLPVGAIPEKSEEESEPTSSAGDPQVEAQ